MIFTIGKSVAEGEVLVPASKSHTIRAYFLAALAEGESVLMNPLVSADAKAAKDAIVAMGAKVKELDGNDIKICGFNGRPSPIKDTIDILNSGTTACFLISMAALSEKPVTIVGDSSTSSRPMAPLLNSLIDLKAKASSHEKGRLPVTITGRAKGGVTKLDGTTSQYLSSLLIHAPLFKEKTVITLDKLNERPYVDMTCWWLDKHKIRYKRDGYKRFEIEGSDSYKAFEEKIPGDFSSATFLAILGAIPGNKVVIRGLDMTDTQGDKAIFSYLEQMGADVLIEDEKITVSGDRLDGIRIDMNATPDAIPAFAAIAALAEGKTELVNVEQARIKETDRISVMAKELYKLGIKTEEKRDSLTVYGNSKLKSGVMLDAHHDHRVAMSLSVLATFVDGETMIDKAESVDVTYPGFPAAMLSCDVKIKIS